MRAIYMSVYSFFCHVLHFFLGRKGLVLFWGSDIWSPWLHLLTLKRNCYFAAIIPVWRDPSGALHSAFWSSSPRNGGKWFCLQAILNRCWIERARLNVLTLCPVFPCSCQQQPMTWHLNENSVLWCHVSHQSACCILCVGCFWMLTFAKPPALEQLYSDLTRVYV